MQKIQRVTSYKIKRFWGKNILKKIVFYKSFFSDRLFLQKTKQGKKDKIKLVYENGWLKSVLKFALFKHFSVC